MKTLSLPHFKLGFTGLVLAAIIPARAADYTWANAAGGNWNVAANWSPVGIPGAADTAAITTTGSYTVIVSDTESAGTVTIGASTADATVQTLNLSSGTLTVNSASTGTAQGILNISGGTLAGAGALTLSGQLNWSSGSIEGTVQCNGGSITGGDLSGGTLINAGTLAWGGSYIFTGSGALLTNEPGATINLAAGTATQNVGGSRTIANAGQFTVAGTGTSTFSDTFINSGTVTVSSGTLQLNGTGTQTGLFTNALGGTLNLSGGTFMFSGASTVEGAGDFALSDATVTFSGTGNITSPVVLSGGALNLNGTGAITPPSLTISGGTEAGTQMIQVNGPINWSSGTIEGTVQCNGGTITGGELNGGTLMNAGTLAWGGSYIFTGSGALLTNEPGATINLAAGTGTQNIGGARTIANAGQFNISGTGTSTFSDAFTNSGTVTISSGTLQFTGTGTQTGLFTNALGGTLNLNGGTFGFGGGSTVEGAGDFVLSDATVTFSGTGNITSPLVLSGGTLNLNGTGAITPASFTMSGGTEAGSQMMQVNGPINWTSGTIEGTLQFNGGSITGGDLSGGTLMNAGTLAWGGSYIFTGSGALLTNEPGATINLAAGTGTQNTGGSRAIANAGQFNVAGTGISLIGDTFINSGKVTISSGTLQLDGGGAESGLFTCQTGGTLDLDSGTFTVSAGSSVEGAGNFTVSGGTVGLGGTWNVTGSNTFSGGTVNFSGSCDITGPLVISGGTLNLSGSGTISPSSLTMSAGTELGSEMLPVNGLINWTGGTISGTVQCDGGSVTGGELSGGTLINAGTLTWGGSYIFTGIGALFTNLPGGTINLAAGTATQNVGGSRTIANAGQFTVAGTGTSTFSDTFINSGTVTVSSGTLQLNGTGTQTGLFTNALGGTLNLSGGTFMFSGASTVEGAGDFALSDATVTFSGTGNITSPVVLSGGALNLNGTGAITPASFTMSGGTEAGSQMMQVNGPINWSSGSLEGTVQCNGGTITGGELNGGTLMNAGTLAWGGSYIFTGSGALLTNEPGATINLAAGTGTQNIGGARTIANAGHINVAGTGTSQISDTFVNSGTVTISSGTFDLTGQYSLTNGALDFGISGATNFGTLNLSGNSVLTCALGASFQGYSPNPGDTFGVITYGSEEGVFNAFDLPSSILWKPVYGASVFSLVVVSLTEPAITLQVIEPPLVTNAFTLLMFGPTGSNYLIQASTGGSLTNWVTLTNFTSVDTSYYFTDTTATNHESRTFRAVLVP